jgi:short-subunit dehydrogenase
MNSKTNPSPWRFAVVVGASSGIGEAIVRQLAEGGCHVAALARRIDRLQVLSAEIAQKTGQHLVLPVGHDVRNGQEAAGLLQKLASDMGGLDLVIYAAGVMPAMDEHEYNLEKEKYMVDVNLVGAIAWLGPAADRFARVGNGTIVGISSIAGERGRRGNPVYCTTKAALNAYLEGLRNRVAAKGVHVVTIKPGFIDTAMTQGQEGLLWLIKADEAARQILMAAQRGVNTAFIPARWGLVGMVIRSIPSKIFRHMKI